tara:strand:+ start:614 stop:1165 length:552 start_codon:yes stop_codon:yes gene_type:complete
MRRNTLALTCLSRLGVAGLLAGVSLAAAAQGGSNLPIQIESNTADFAQKTGVSTYTGNVHLTRGGLTLTGTRLVITRVNDRGNIKAVLTGNPAHIDKQPDSTSPERITGHADQLEYTNANAVLTLRGDAMLNRAGGDTISSPVITRDLDTGQTQAQGSGGAGAENDGRVRITIQPDSADEAGS